MTYLRVAIPFFWGGKDNRDLAKDVSVLLGCPQPVFALFLWFLPGICVLRLPCIAAIFAVSCFIYHLAAGFPYTQHICHDIWLPKCQNSRVLNPEITRVGRTLDWTPTHWQLALRQKPQFCSRVSTMAQAT